MSYRLLRISSLYNEYLSNYYNSFPEIKQLNYTEQYEHLSNNSFDLVLSYSKYFRKIGIDAIDIITNAEPLQNTWAKEHNLSSDVSFNDLIISQIKYYKPDIIWIDDSRLMNKSWIQNLRIEVKSIKLIVGHICAPYNAIIENSLSSFDIMFNCAPCTQKKFVEMGLTSYSFYHSFDPEVLNVLKTESNNFPETNFVFTGSLYTGFGMHKTRIEYIEKILSNKIDINIFGNLEPRSKILLKQSMYYTINTLKTLNLSVLIDKIPLLKKYEQYGDEKINSYSKKLINSIAPPVFGLDMLKVLSKSKICFNIHGEIAKKCAGNIRLFEATGVGSCLVTDWKENMSDLFVEDKEVVLYKTVEECIEKVQWLMNNPVEAKKIAIAGQARTIKDHNVENRVAGVDEIFRHKL